MRYMVEQGQITGSRQKIVLSGISFCRRRTRLISVPTAQVDPGCSSPNHINNVLGRPIHVRGLDHWQRTFRMDDDLDIRMVAASLFDLGDREPGMNGAIALPQEDDRIPQFFFSVPTQRQEGIPNNHAFLRNVLTDGGVATKMLVGEKEDAFAALQRPVVNPGCIRRRADDATVATTESLE